MTPSNGWGFSGTKAPEWEVPMGPIFSRNERNCIGNTRKSWFRPVEATTVSVHRNDWKNSGKSRQKRKEPIGYDRFCRNLSPEEVERRKREGQPYVIRLKIPLEGTTTFHDRPIGTVVHANKDINPDPVLLKSDGYPTYHLANVVDDHHMKITHILRAQEWIPSCPLHVLIYQSFGWEPPEYCHLPMVMGSDGHKLSKRHGSTSLIEFRNAGYVPEAIINYVSLLGWSYDDSRQLFTKADLERLFTLDKLNKAPAVFDYKKLEWFNGVYIRERDREQLKKRVDPLPAEGRYFE